MKGKRSKRVAVELGAITVTKATYDEHGQYGATTILRRLKSWNLALQAAGLALSNRVNIPDEELFENLAALWQDLGRQPVGKDVAKSLSASHFALTTYEKRFGSWNKALLAFISYIDNPDETAIDHQSAKIDPSISRNRTPRKINWRLRAQVLIRDNCICKMCGASPAKDPDVVLHVDHIVPWSKNGETVLSNLQTLCSVCNIGKSDEIFYENSS